MTSSSNTKEFFQTAFREMMKSVATSIPGHILAFDPSTQLAQIQIGVKRIDIDGVEYDAPPLIECPVYVFGGAYCVEVELQQGHEGIILFSQRCIDGWSNTGGIGNNVIKRFHSFDDAMFLPGMRSQPNALPSYQNNGVRLRNQDGSKYIWLKNDGTAEIQVDTLIINGDIIQTGDNTINGQVQCVGLGNYGGTGPLPMTGGINNSGGDIVSDGISLENHVHSGVTPGGSNTGGPV